MRKFIIFLSVWAICILLFAGSSFAQKGEVLDKGENRLNNGDFEEDPILPWTLEVRQDLGAAAVMETTKVDPHGGKRCVRVDVTTPTTDWHVKLRQDDRCFEKNEKFSVVFWCRAEKVRSVSGSFQLQHDPWTGFFSQKFSVDTEWKEYSLTFTPNVDNFQDHWFAFHVGDSNIPIWFDDVRYFLGEPKDEVGHEPVKQAVESKDKLSTKWAQIKLGY